MHKPSEQNVFINKLIQPRFIVFTHLKLKNNCMTYINFIMYIDHGLNVRFTWLKLPVDNTFGYNMTYNVSTELHNTGLVEI